MSSSSSLILSVIPRFICLLTFTARTIYSQKTISSAAELVEFSKEVGNGTTYLGATVTLANDIDLSGVEFTPIGRYETSKANISFRGVFEGNGHLIKNMNVTISASIYAGLFGYTVGCTIKNVAIDSSCSVTNNKNNNIQTYAGGIISYADAGTGVGETAILNCVNMGTITGSGPYSRVGGIAGVLYAFKSPAKIVNCVNLGNIVYSGTTVTEVYVGGIAGWMTLKNEYNVSSICNCVNMGTITTSTTVTYIGAIVGTSYNSTGSLNIIRNNYWVNGTGLQCYNGDANASNNEELNTSYILSSGGSLVDALNEYVDSQPSYELRKWGTVTFDTNGGSTVGARMTMFVMLGTPDIPTRIGGTFDGWYTDSAFKTEFSMATRYDSGVGASLYAKWIMNQYSVVFDFGNGTRTEETVLEYNKTIIYPVNPMMEGYTFNGWDKNITNMPAENITITAMWKAIPTEYVEIVFNKKDMTEDEVNKIISKYVQNDNYVIKIVESENDETKVIIKFNDASEAEEFIESVELSIKDDSAINNLIKRITPVDEKDDGFSLPISVFLLHCVLSLLS